MTRVDVVAMVGSVLVAVATFALIEHCTPAEATDGRIEYGSANEACVRLATSREQAVDCIRRVRDTWCNPGTGLVRDAGTCAADGGVK